MNKLNEVLEFCKENKESSETREVKKVISAIIEDLITNFPLQNSLYNVNYIYDRIDKIQEALEMLK